MAVRFVLGRAGSGKTFRCLEAVRARLREDAAEGHRLLLLVPEQASFQMERALIETPDIPGYSRCEVVSFQRLAFRIFTETGADPRRSDETIGSLGRLMLIRRLIRREKSELRVLGRVADKPGLIKQVAASIEELMRENVAPETLAELAGAAEAEDPLGAAKLADLQRLYHAYLGALQNDRLDPAQYLNLAADRLDGCPWLNGAEVWVDGFAGFSAQEYRLLLGLAKRARSMEITLLVDPGTTALFTESLPPLSWSLFSRTERTLVRLRREIKAAGLPLAEPAKLPDSGRTRFGTDALSALEQHLFMPASARRHPPVRPDGAVSIWELPDRRCEVDAVIAEIERLRREADPPMRYRDMAVIVRDLAAYHDLLSAALRAHGIPCFIDRRLPTTQHPLIELVRGLLAIAVEDCRLEAVRLVLKTGLLPVAARAADLLENYVLAHGISGRAVWDQPWHYTRIFRHKGEGEELSSAQREILEQVNHAREAWQGALGGWLKVAVGDREEPGQRWAEALFGCLQHLAAGTRLYAWADEAEAAGRHDEADAHRQVWTDFVTLLDEFVRALGAEPMRLAEFRETMEAGLAEFNLGLAPATLDQVLVGAIERSRHPPVRAVLMLGFDERHFPLRRSEDPLLGDREREALNGAGMEVSASRGQQLLDERMLAYIALTRASERLIISYPRAEADGKPVGPSPYLRDVLAALPGVAVTRCGDARAERLPEWLTRVGELGARLAREFRYRGEAGEDGDPQRRAFWNALYEAARRQPDWQARLGRALAGLKYQNAAKLEAGLIDRAVEKPFAASVSRLERFAACPYSHYLEYLLRLEPRIESDMGDVDLGLVCHAILEKFIGGLAERGERLADLEDDAIAAGIDAASKEIIPRISDDMMIAEARNAFLVDRSHAHLRRVLRWQRESARAGAFRPYKVEYPFGYKRPGCPEFKMTTPAGRTIYLRGKIDRVDIADHGGELLGVVIDYKRTTSRTLDLAKTFHGLTLQLVGYLLAVKAAGRTLAGRTVKPIAALYLPLLEPYQTVPHPAEQKRVSYQWRGIADASAIKALDADVGPGGASKYLAVRLTRCGEPYANCDAARSDHFAALMTHVGRQIGALADRLLDGDITISPYRLRRAMPCSFCMYKPVCRYEIETQPPRTLVSLRKQDVFEQICGGGEK